MWIACSFVDCFCPSQCYVCLWLCWHRWGVAVRLWYRWSGHRGSCMDVEPIVSISFNSQEVMIEFTSFVVGCVGAITQRTRSRCVLRFLALHGIMFTSTLHTHKGFVAISFWVSILLTYHALYDAFGSLGCLYDCIYIQQTLYFEKLYIVYRRFQVYEK